MSEAVQCNPKQEDVADDWENADDEALVASVAERQKQLAQIQTKMAAERQQLKIEQIKPSAITDKRSEMSSGPVRLLRRPQSGTQLKQKSDAELAKEAEERAQKALEQREVAYQQAREKIFGEQQEAAETAEAAVESGMAGPSDPAASAIAVASTSSINRDHLSDVPMKRADTYRPHAAKVVVPPPPPMQPMMLPPWGYNPQNCPMPGFTGIPPVNFNPYFCPPVTTALPMGFHQPQQFGPLNPFQIPPHANQLPNNQRPVPLSSVGGPKGVWNNPQQSIRIPPMMGQAPYQPYYSQPKNVARFPNQ